jgi:thiamine kinase-like enzyme
MAPSEALAQFQKRTGLKIGRFLDGGAQGAVYAIVGHPNKVVKFACGDDYSIKKMREIIKYLKRTKNLSVVKVHKFGALCNKEYYFYIMDRLRNVREKAIRAPSSCSWITKLYYADRIAEYLNGCSVPADEHPRIKSFIKKARKLRYSHHDCHEGNIMRSKRGALKFIDLESFN